MLGFLLSLPLSKPLLVLLTAQAGRLVFFRPAEAFMVHLKLAFINGIVVSLPILLWQAGAFVWPALYPRERRYVGLFLPLGFLFFGLGLAFGYLVIVRLGYRFLLSFASATLRPMIGLDTYLSFVLSSMLVCGVFFLMPLAVLFLAKLGLIRAGFLWRQQGKIIVGLAVLVAIVTPTVDAFSMMLVFVPILALFELSILLAWLVERRTAKRAESRPENKTRIEQDA